MKIVLLYFIQEIVDYVNVNSEKTSSGELTETDLDNVNGGIAVATLGAWFLTSVFINRVAYLGRLWLGR